jgi:predicted protein tyrosine phosphatase
MKILFVSNKGENRSPTAKRIFSKKYKTKSAGIYTLIKENRINKYVIDWADVILVMEEVQRGYIAQHFPEEYIKKKIIVMNVLDIYTRNQIELVKLLRKKIKIIRRTW